MKKDNIIAYSGKIIEYNNKQYRLEPEQALRGCEGCDLTKNKICLQYLNQYCFQGYIFKLVKKP